MPCNFVKIKYSDGSIGQAIVCSRSKASTCLVCGKPATKLCDGIPRMWPTVKPVDGTCSAPLCALHATQLNTPGDYCPRCVEMMKGKAI